MTSVQIDFIIDGVLAKIHLFVRLPLQITYYSFAQDKCEDRRRTATNETHKWVC